MVEKVTIGTVVLLVIRVITVTRKSMVILVTMVTLKAKVTTGTFETLVTKIIMVTSKSMVMLVNMVTPKTR